MVADILLIIVLFKYRTRPSHLLAKMAQYMVAVGGILLLLGIALQLAFKWPLWHLGFLSALITGVGACIVLAVGVGCELAMRNRYLLGDRPQWVIARRVNFERLEDAAT